MAFTLVLQINIGMKRHLHAFYWQCQCNSGVKRPSAGRRGNRGVKIPAFARALPTIGSMCRFVLCCLLGGALAATCTASLTGRIASPAAAAIVSPSVLDGPSANILDLDGAAMAPDGSGGIVYRKLVAGEPHVFVSQFLGGAFRAPIQVDNGRLGPASDPSIAAADGGELLVVWVEPWTWISATPGAQATLHYGLEAGVLQPGAREFSQVERVDDLGSETAAFQSLAMAANGTAYVAYREAQGDLRVARYNGLAWSALGVIDRLPGQVALRPPSSTDAPAIAVNSAGQALVVWQEPDIEGVARIWARRLFGTVKGNVLQVSPSTIAGAPVTTDADAPAVALNENGEAVIAFRLAGGAGSPLGAPHLLLNTLPMPLTEEISSFTGAVALDGAAVLGAPSVALDAHGNFRVAYPANGATREISGAEDKSGAPLVLGPSAGPALEEIDPEGGGTTVWPSPNPGGQPAVQVRQDYPGGASQTAYLSAPISGPVDGLLAAQSGLGDGLVAFEQGSTQYSQIVGSLVQSPPPAKFAVRVPSGWVNGAHAAVSWEAVAQDVGRVTYSVLVDGRVVARGLPGLTARLDSRALGDGIRRVQVLASDNLAQQTLSRTVDLQVDTNPPLVGVRRLSRGRVQVRVYDRASGVRAPATLVAFGDGARITGRDTVVHTYRRAGRYTITVHAADKVGNRRDVQIPVQVR
jgi:PKD domain